MNEQHDLESQLGQLPLRQPSPQLDRRVRQTMAASHRLWRWLAVAACIGGFGFLLGYLTHDWMAPATDGASVPQLADDPSPDADTEQPLQFDPQRIDMVWEQTIPAGLYTIDDGPPFQALRRLQIDRTFWVDTERNITVETSEPHEEVILIRQTPS